MNGIFKICFTVVLGLGLNICGMEYFKITYPSCSRIKDLWNGIF